LFDCFSFFGIKLDLDLTQFEQKAFLKIENKEELYV